MRILKPHWPLITSAGLLLIIVVVQLTLSIRENNGNQVYALDDPYIHMAMARNLARDGVWGVTRYQFSSSTSSLLWTLALSAIYFFTSSPAVPLIFNIASGLLVLVVASRLLEGTPNLMRLALLCSLVLLVPLPALILSGMEHTTHVLVILPLLFAGSKVVAADSLDLKNTQFRLLLLLAVLAPLIRYESLFLIASTMVLLWLRRYFLAGVILLAVALTPLIFYGLLSWSYGSLLLPNPLLLKGSLPRQGLAPFLEQALFKLLAAPHILFLLLFASWLFLRHKTEDNRWKENRVALFLFILTTVLHLLFAGIGWFFRYEAYLLALGIISVGRSMSRGYANTNRVHRRLPLAAAITLTLSLLAGFALLLRAHRALAQTVQATKDIHDQQFQMARFLKTYYSGAAVAANDIGAINFFADIRCLDLRGLGDVEVTRAKLEGTFNSDKIAQLAAAYQIRIALLYSVWFQWNETLPEGWIKVGEWTIRNCVVCGDPTVSFYAANAHEAETLKRNLRDFSTRLPADVIQAWPFTQPNE